jgi:phenylpropionate dioxygenase-like ring-hydroxylating dioxygenase large terminal subunit
MNQIFTGNPLTCQYPDLGTGPVPVDIYHEPAVFEKEREAIFKKCWHLVGRVEQVAEPGAFFVYTLPTFGHSILICRDKERHINGFHNVCQHRGSVVQHRAEGKCAVFTCRFHGWSYDLKGQLVRVRDEEGFCDLNKEKLRLPPIATQVWQGFVFIHLDEKPTESLEEYMG